MSTQKLTLQSAWPLIVAVFLIRLNVASEASELSTHPGYITRNWDTEEGLPFGNISALAKTRDGLLWVGSPGGLVRYDGLQFNSFFPGNAAALSVARPSGLFTDQRGD